MNLLHLTFLLLALSAMATHRAIRICLVALAATTTARADDARGVATKYTLPLDKYPDARCLDGSPGAYYLSPPPVANNDSSKFYVYQMGGGFCTDLDDCLARSRTYLGRRGRRCCGC